MTEVKILRPSLDDNERQTVLRGVVSSDTLVNLRVDNYQRERLASSSRREIVRALDMGRNLPTIELGMRGDRFRIDDDGSVMLIDPVFIIDGRQRRDTIIEYLDRFPDERVRLGAVVHFNTDAKWERDRFHALNLFQHKVAPSVMLRNIKEDNPMLATMFGLTKSAKDFAMYGRVCWSQNMGRGELISGLAYCQTALLMHAHLAAVRSISMKEITNSADKLTRAVGLPIARNNIIEFWNLVDASWGVRAIQYKSSAPYMRTQFLRVLARVLSDHSDFWQPPDERRLVIPYELKRKIARFAVNDPEVVRLSGASGRAADTLYFMMVTHINSGKRTKRLSPRNGIAPIAGDDDDELDAAVA